MDNFDEPLWARAAVKYTTAHTNQPWSTSERINLSAALARAVAATPRSNPWSVQYALVVAFSEGKILTGTGSEPIDPASWDWSRIDILHWDDNRFRLVTENRDCVFANVEVSPRDLDCWCANAEVEVNSVFGSG
jgi:hypothetical protein